MSLQSAAAALVLMLGLTAARADPVRLAVSRVALDETLDVYFRGEEAQGYAWLAIGNASLAAGGTLALQENRALRAMSVPLLVVGFVQLVSGMSSLTRADARLAGHHRAAAADPAAVRAAELGRIRRINFLFKVIKVTEVVLLGLGTVGTVVGGAVRQDELLGVSAGVAVEAALMLVLDHFAERRAHRYEAALGAISFTVGPRAAGTPLLLGFTRRF